MKRFGTLFAALAVLASPAFAVDPLEGRWLTTQDDNGNSGIIEVAACADKLCGVLIMAFGPDGKQVTTEHIGRQIIWATENKGGGVYRGKVYSPDRDKTYNSKLVLNGDLLSVSGCMLGACRQGGQWRRQ